MTSSEITKLNNSLASCRYIKLLLDGEIELSIINAIKVNKFIEHSVYIYIDGKFVESKDGVTGLRLNKYIKGYSSVDVLNQETDIDKAYKLYKESGLVDTTGSVLSYFSSLLGGDIDLGIDKKGVDGDKDIGLDELAQLFGVVAEVNSSNTVIADKGIAKTADQELEEIKGRAKEFLVSARKLKLKTDKTFADSITIQRAVNIQNVLNNMKVGCDRCNRTGYVVDEETGITVQCDCVVSNLEVLKRQLAETSAPNYILQNETAMSQLLDMVIPKQRQDDEFSISIGKDKILEILKGADCRVVGVTDFLDKVGIILSEIALGLIGHSYILGAPNGFGKTTFVYTAIKRLMAQGKKVVPYKSLTELAQVKIDYEKDILAQFKFGFKGEKKEKGFTWKDYLDADVLFTYLSTPSSGELESAVLSALMSIRGNNRKPTIVMTSTSLKIYTANPELYKYYWCDMLDNSIGESKDNVGPDRLIHHSCYMIKQGPDYTVKKGRDY